MKLIAETHISRVFADGNRVFKVRKHVRFPFVDQSTHEQRRALCDEEVRLNRALAPNLYVGVTDLNGEPAVEMVRLPADGMLDRLLEDRQFDRVRSAIPDIVEQLAAFHEQAERVPEYQSQDALRRRIDSIFEVGEAQGSSEYWAPLRRFFETLPDPREVIEGHGDLHAGNLCLTPDGVCIYDRLEFSREMRCGEVAFDLSFLVMSLDAAGAAPLARDLIERYAARTRDEGLAQAVAFYVVQRAIVRANVSVMRGRDAAEREAFLRQAAIYTHAPRALLLCGLPATGKSTWAAKWPLENVRTDAIRREITQRSPDEQWTGGFIEGPYRPEVTDRVYQRVADDARAILACHRSVVVDASLSTETRRSQVVEAVGSVPWDLVYFDPEDSTVQRNLAQRAASPDLSDADRATRDRLAQTFNPPARFITPDEAEAELRR